jgi:hypothetical protein
MRKEPGHKILSILDKESNQSCGSDNRNTISPAWNKHMRHKNHKNLSCSSIVSVLDKLLHHACSFGVSSENALDTFCEDDRLPEGLLAFTHKAGVEAKKLWMILKDKLNQ